MTIPPEDVVRAAPVKKIDGEFDLKGSPRRSFESFMEEAGRKDVGQNSVGTPFDLPRQQSLTQEAPSYDVLLGKANLAEQNFNQIRSSLNAFSEKGIGLDPSQGYLIGSKLNKARDHIGQMNALLGVEGAVDSSPKTGGVMGKFINLLTEGQSNLVSAQQAIVDLKNKGGSLNSSYFLKLQVKLSQAQQELEFASVTLSKMVEGIKALMNVQI